MFNLFKKKPSIGNCDSKYQNFVKKLDSYSWEDYNKVCDLIQPAIEVVQSNFEKGMVGGSKLGGTPDLPDSFSWPKYKGKSMVFFAQINLSELSEFHNNELLPNTGIIYYFTYFQNPENEYGAEYGFIPSKEEYKVLFFDGAESTLKSSTYPNDLFEEYKFKPEALSFDCFFHLPPSLETIAIETASLSPKDQDLIEEFNEVNYPFCDQILGIPAPMQYGADYDLAVSFLGLDIDFADYESRKEEVDKIRADFVNLLSIPVFERIGDSQAYFGISIHDLKNKDFGKTVFIMQGT